MVQRFTESRYHLQTGVVRMAQVAGYIKRKSMLYRTGVEYGDYTINFIQGCAHGCKYPCYAFSLKKRFGQVKTYDDWLKPYIVENTLELLDKEIPKLKDKIESVHLCFSTDPFMYGYPEISDLAIKSIQRLNQEGIKCTVLTKGVLPQELFALSKHNEYGITLVSLSEKYREEIEPGAAPIEERLESLKWLHERGCKTWVSIEPYPTPNIIEQELSEILDAVSFVDKIIFGKTNYSRNTSAYKNYKEFYNQCAEKVLAFCEKRKIVCHIKNKTISEQ